VSNYWKSKALSRLYGLMIDSGCRKLFEVGTGLELVAGKEEGIARLQILQKVVKQPSAALSSIIKRRSN